MGFLKKIRNNILNQQNSFHVGFGNRSPFSYKGEYAGDWTPEVPDIVIPKPTSQIPVLDAEIALVGKVADTVTKVANAAIKQKIKKDAGEKAKEKRDAQYSKAFQKIGERIEEKPEFTYEPTIPINEMIPTTSTSSTNTYHNLYPDTPTKTTQDIKNEFNQKKCNFDGGIWDSTTNTCK